MEKVLLTPEETAQVLSIGRSKVYQLMSCGQLRSVRIGGSRRVPIESVNDFIATLLLLVKDAALETA